MKTRLFTKRTPTTTTTPPRQEKSTKEIQRQSERKRREGFFWISGSISQLLAFFFLIIFFSFILCHLNIVNFLLLPLDFLLITGFCPSHFRFCGVLHLYFLQPGSVWKGPSLGFGHDVSDVRHVDIPFQINGPD